MRRNPAVILFLAVLSIVSGYLMSKASLVGKAGMSLFYREYNFLKTWWKGGMLVFTGLLLLFLIQGYIQKQYEAKKARTVHLLACVFALAGLYFTYNDFRHTLSHRLLGERFHVGAYLFWVGWMAISCSYLFRVRTTDNPGRDLPAQETLK